LQISTVQSISSEYNAYFFTSISLSVTTGGYLTKFKDGLSFMTVRYAGHEVPAYQPQKALELLRRYLDGSLFDTSRH
jgi:carboxypeptidase C (cathepsin A)